MTPLQSILTTAPGRPDGEAVLAVIGPDGKVYSLSMKATDRGSIDSILSEAVKEQPYTIRNAGKTRGLPYGASFDASGAVLTVMLKSLTIATTYANEGGVMVPVFGSSGAAASKVWEAPHGVTLAMLCGVSPTPDGKWILDKERVYLCRTMERGFSRPPLPNLYGDGRICTGANRATAGTLSDAANQAMGMLMDAQYNTDLSGSDSIAACKAAFRWDNETGNQLDPLDGAINSWAPINTSIFNRITQ